MLFFNALNDNLRVNLGGCSLEQEGGNFYIVGADSVRKKLGSISKVYVRFTASGSYPTTNNTLGISFDNANWITLKTFQLNHMGNGTAYNSTVTAEHTIN